MTDDVKTSIAARAAQELRPGEIVNLGIGIPNLIPGLLGGADVFLHTENGLLGVGPRPGEDRARPGSHRRGEATRDRARRRRVLRQRPELRDDPRRPHRRRGARRPAGLGLRRHRELGRPGEGRARRRRGDGPRGRGAPRDRDDDRDVVDGRAEGRLRVHLPPDGARRRRRRRHRALRLPARDGALVLTELLGDATVEQVQAATGARSTSTWRIAVQPETGLPRIPDAR